MTSIAHHKLVNMSVSSEILGGGGARNLNFSKFLTTAKYAVISASLTESLANNQKLSCVSRVILNVRYSCQ